MDIMLSSSVLHVPSATIAAHATDELVEIEMEENVQVVENIFLGILKGGASTRPEAPRTPPIPPNSYSKIGLMVLFLW